MFMGSVVVAPLGERREVGGGDWLDMPEEPSGVRGDIEPSSGRALCTGVFSRASDSRLNGSSFCESEVEAMIKAGRG